MRMCYLSISHTNVFSVTVPPGRLQEGSGALIKAAFAGQECGLLRLGVTEGLGVRSQSLYSHGQPASRPAGRPGPGLPGLGAWLQLGICALSLAFPLRPLALPALALTHSHAATHTHTHTHPSVSPLSHLWSSGCRWTPWQPVPGQLCAEAQEITVLTLPLPRSGPKLQGEEQN